MRYQLGTHDARTDEDPDEPPSLTPPPPADQLDSTLSVIGPAFTYDTTDSHTQPRRGVEIDATWTFGFDELGDSYDHDKLMAEGHAYFSHRPNARCSRRARSSAAPAATSRTTTCACSAPRPTCAATRPGATATARAGRCRARCGTSSAERWGGVAFLGIGGIAPSAGDLVDEGNLLPAGGIGVRYRPFKSNDVQLRVDLALGKNDHGVYVGIGEAF